VKLACNLEEPTVNTFTGSRRGTEHVLNEWRKLISHERQALLRLANTVVQRLKKRSNSAFEMRMWRNARFGLMSPLSISRRTVI